MTTARPLRSNSCASVVNADPPAAHAAVARRHPITARAQGKETQPAVTAGVGDELVAD